MTGKKKHGVSWLRLVIFTVFMLLMTGGTLAGLYYYMDYILDNGERQGFTGEDLNTPLSDPVSVEMEEPPLFISPGHVSAFSCRLLWPINGTSESLDAIPGIGAMVNLSLKNEGLSNLYVERIRFSTGYGEDGEFVVNKYVPSGKLRYLRHVNIPYPDPAPPLIMSTYTLRIDVLVEGNPSWARKENMSFDEAQMNPIPHIAGRTPPEYVLNDPYYFDKVNGLIKDDLDQLKEKVIEEGLDDGNFTIHDIANAFDFVSRNIEYLPDPDTGSNEWISPMTCLARGGGDCEDYSVLLGGIIQILGGNARVIITSHHAFNAVYIGDDDSILEDLEGRYGTSIPFQIFEDELGKWLIIEPQSFLVFGWFPSDVRTQRVSDGIHDPSSYIYGNTSFEWVYEDSEKVYIVDIYI